MSKTIRKQRREISAEIERDDAVGEATRAAIGKQARDLYVQQQCCGGLNFGYFYDGSPIIAYDGAPHPDYSMGQFTSTTVPGCRAPHFWLRDGRSLYDALGGGLRVAPVRPDRVRWMVWSRRRSGAACRSPCSTSTMPRPAALYASKLVLVRPDRHVAWRGDAEPDDPLELIDHLRGARMASTGAGSPRSRRRYSAAFGGRRGIDEAAGLPPPQLGVVPAGAQQLGVRALFDDAAAVEHHQPVHPRDGGEPVRDGDHGLAGHQRVEARLDRGLDLAVERGGGLVEHQDRRVLQDHAGDGDALALAAGQLDAALADMGVVAAPAAPVLQLEDEVVGLRLLRRGDDLGLGGVGLAVADVVADRAVQQRGVLRHHRDLRAQAFLRGLRDVLAVDQDARRPRDRRSAASG